MEIKTDNLLLKQFSEDDITEEYVNALNDMDIVRLTEARHEKWDMESARKYVRESNKEGVSVLIGIFLKDSGKHIGNIRLSGFNPHHKRAELGIMIFDKEQWSKGFGTESLNAVCDYAFKDLNIHKICADYYSINRASEHMFKKAGFLEEGIFKEHFLLDGNYIDSVRVARFNDNGE